MPRVERLLRCGQRMKNRDCENPISKNASGLGIFFALMLAFALPVNAEDASRENSEAEHEANELVREMMHELGRMEREVMHEDIRDDIKGWQAYAEELITRGQEWRLAAMALERASRTLALNHYASAPYKIASAAHNYATGWFVYAEAVHEYAEALRAKAEKAEAMREK